MKPPHAGSLPPVRCAVVRCAGRFQLADTDPVDLRLPFAAAADAFPLLAEQLG